MKATPRRKWKSPLTRGAWRTIWVGMTLDQDAPAATKTTPNGIGPLAQLVA
jgi:hypothetical protein